MGANAQTTVQKFVDGAVLTAAQQNTSAATGVPVFATTVTRDAAFGGANKVLAEGQTCYLESTDVVQYYDGAAWATVGPAAAGALVVVQAETAFTGVTSFNANATIFSATYTNYLIQLNLNSVSGTVSTLTWQGRTGGATNSTANYGFQNTLIANVMVIDRAGSGATGIRFFNDTGGWTRLSENLTIFNPFATEQTRLAGNGDADLASTLLCGGGFNATTSFDSFAITLAGGGNMTGTYTVYGVSK